MLYPTHREPMNVLFSSRADLDSFLMNNAYPDVSRFNREHFLRILPQVRYCIIGVDDILNESKKKHLTSTLEEVAKDRTNNFGFFYDDSNKVMSEIIGIGASGTVLPTLVAVPDGGGQTFAYDESLPFTKENVAKWIDGLLDGTTKQYVKSQPIPENDNGPVKTLVAKNFDSIKGKPALVKYYAPWCGHCKVLEPIYRALAEKLADKNIVIAEVDATANQIDEQVSSYPTIFYYDGFGGKVKFEGDRTVDELEYFVISQLPPEPVVASKSSGSSSVSSSSSSIHRQLALTMDILDGLDRLNEKYDFEDELAIVIESVRLQTKKLRMENARMR